MRKIIEPFIRNFADTLGQPIYKITYQGKGVSLNQIYAQGHWRTRAAIKKKYKPIFDQLIKDCEEIQFMDKFSVWIFYNSRHDPDNIIGMEKLFVDSLKGKYVEDDHKKYFRGVSIFPDEELDSNTFEFYLLRHE